MSNQVKQHVGIAWYKPWEWEKLREAVSDPELLELTHSAWLKIAQKSFRELKANGIDCERVVLSVDELVTWCREREMPVNAAARSQFAADKLRLRSKDR